MTKKTQIIVDPIEEIEGIGDNELTKYGVPLKEQVQDFGIKHKELVIGETYKITGGKYKKFKQCVLQKINNTYSDCELPLKEFNADNKCLNQIVKIKNLYLLPMKVNTIEMPNTEDLMVVDNLDNFLNDNPKQKIKFADMAIDKPNIKQDIKEEIRPTEKDETIVRLKNDNEFLLKELDTVKQELINALDMGKTNREKDLEQTLVNFLCSVYK
jgi:hypothetical protein